jgi:hypothetical protein
MGIPEILKKDLLYNDLLKKFEPLNYTEVRPIELLSLPINSYKYIQLTGLPLNPIYEESFNVTVKSLSDNVTFSETSNPDSIGESQYWINYHEQNFQQNGRIYFNDATLVGEQFEINYPFIGTANNYRNIYELTFRQLYDLGKTVDNKLDAGSLIITNLGDGVDTDDAVNRGQLNLLSQELNNDIGSLESGLNSIFNIYTTSQVYTYQKNEPTDVDTIYTISEKKGYYDITAITNIPMQSTGLLNVDITININAYPNKGRQFVVKYYLKGNHYFTTEFFNEFYYSRVTLKINGTTIAESTTGNIVQGEKFYLLGWQNL